MSDKCSGVKKKKYNITPRNLAECKVANGNTRVKYLIIVLKCSTCVNVLSTIAEALIYGFNIKKPTEKCDKCTVYYKMTPGIKVF